MRDEDNEMVMISAEISKQKNELIIVELEALGGISRSAFIRQAIDEKLHRLAAMK